MPKKNIFIMMAISLSLLLMLSFQNCGRQLEQAPEAKEKIVVDDFKIVGNDCNANTCKVTVAKISTRLEQEGEGLRIHDEDIPQKFVRLDEESGKKSTCIFVNRRDDIRYEYLCDR